MGPQRGEVIFEEWMSNPKAVLLEGKQSGEEDAQRPTDSTDKAEWVLKQDASGRFVCVKEVQGPLGERAGLPNDAGGEAGEELPEVPSEKKGGVESPGKLVVQEYTSEVKAQTEEQEAEEHEGPGRCQSPAGEPSTESASPSRPSGKTTTGSNNSTEPHPALDRQAALSSEVTQPRVSEVDRSSPPSPKDFE